MSTNPSGSAGNGSEPLEEFLGSSLVSRANRPSYRCLMKFPLIALAVVVLVLVVAVRDPAGPVGPVVGWAIYLVLGVIVQPWGLLALAALAALAAIVWVLRQPTR